MRIGIAAAFATRPAAEWVAELGPAGVTISFVHEGSTLVDDPQVRARGAVVDGRRAAGTRKPDPHHRRRRSAACDDRRPPPPPATGADTDAVLAEVGCSADDIAAMRASGLLGAPP